MADQLQQDWTEIQVSVPAEKIETAGNIANMTVPYGIYIEDYSDVVEETLQIAHVDLISEELLGKDRTKGIIHIYISPEENPAEAVSFLEERLNAEQIEHKITIDACKTEDWINNWKKYWHPVPVGKKLLIKPEWEQVDDTHGRAVLELEPGLAFGTGSHPTTRLCLEIMEDYIHPASTVLDVGCGSGILSIAALLLGAKSAFGVDIDKLAVKTALANAEKNGFTPPVFDAVSGELSENVSGRYSVVIANIVADVIMKLTPQAANLLKENGVFITGGIIDPRKDEVEACFAKNGFEILEHRESKGWHVFVCERK